MENKCVICGAVIPEGRQVCPFCEKGEESPELRKRTIAHKRQIRQFMQEIRAGEYDVSPNNK